MTILIYIYAENAAFSYPFNTLATKNSNSTEGKKPAETRTFAIFRVFRLSRPIQSVSCFTLHTMCVRVFAPGLLCPLVCLNTRTEKYRRSPPIHTN